MNTKHKLLITAISIITLLLLVLPFGQSSSMEFGENILRPSYIYYGFFSFIIYGILPVLWIAYFSFKNFFYKKICLVILIRDSFFISFLSIAPLYYARPDLLATSVYFGLLLFPLLMLFFYLDIKLIRARKLQL